MRRISLASFILGWALLSCGGGKEETSRSSIRDIEDLTVRQNAIHGKEIYDQLCANCHQTDGTGLGRLIPPLADSDYMKADIGRTIRLIKYGIEGEMTVNGIVYNQPMPPNPRLTPVEIAQIATYIYNVWGDRKGAVSLDDVEGYLYGEEDQR